MISDILKEKKISCYALAKKAQIPYTTLNEIIRGERALLDCSVRVLKSLADALDMSMDAVLALAEQRKQIPESLYPCFWDTDTAQLDLVKHRSYIIPRLLDKGGYEGVVFVKNAYTYHEIKEVARTSRNLSPKIASFLSNVYHLKTEEMAFYQLPWRNWQ